MCSIDRYKYTVVTLRSGPNLSPFINFNLVSKLTSLRIRGHQRKRITRSWTALARFARLIEETHQPHFAWNRSALPHPLIRPIRLNIMRMRTSHPIKRSRVPIYARDYNIRRSDRDLSSTTRMSPKNLEYGIVYTRDDISHHWGEPTLFLVHSYTLWTRACGVAWKQPSLLLLIAQKNC